MITGTFTTAVGDISITMDDGGAGAYVEVSQLGNLKYEFDQTPDSVQIDRTIALYSYIQVVFESLTESSEDLYTRLVDATAATPIDCTLSIDNFGVDTFDFSFELKQENIDYNEKEGTVAVRFTPKIDKEVTISNVFSSVTNYQYQPLQRDTVPDTLFNTNLNCLPVEDYLEASMQSVFANNFDAYIKLSKTSSNVSYFRSNASWDDGTNGFVIVDPADLPLPLKAENFQEPEELTVTANVTSNVTVFGPYNDNGITVDYFSYYEYYVEATDLFNEFPVGTAIGWFADDQTVGPLGILRSKSSSSNVVVVGPVITDSLPIGSTAPVGGSEQILTSTRIFVYDSELNQVANDSIKELAGIEGSIYGTGFSKNFYVHRLSDNDTEYVTLNYDLVSEIKQKKLNKFLQATVVRQIADYNNEGLNQFGQIPDIEIGTGLTRSLRIPLMRGAGAFVRGNENATKSLEINLAPVYPFLNKASKTGNRYIAFSATSNTAQTALEKSITSAGARSYSQSLNQQSGGAKIEFTYLDALALKPYEVFQFDSTAPEKYQNRQYRITSIAYDFVKNESKVVGYQISNLSAPIVIDDTDDTDNGGGETTEPPVTGQGFKYYPGWNFISNPTDTDKDVLDVFGNDYADLTLYQFAGSYVVEPTTSSLYNKVLASNNGSPAGVYKTPGYVINLQSSNETEYFWDGQRQESNVTNIELFEGWNLIGSIGVPATLQPSASNAAGINDQAIYGFNGSYFLTGFNLLPGQSYWAWSSNTGNVDIVTSSASTSSIVNLNNEFKRVAIRTSSASQLLYFDGTNTNTNVNIQQAFLPPAIGATFDVRINQDETNTALRDLRAVESNTINIDVQQIDSATTLNITPKIGVAAGSYYQATFLNGDKIITAQNIAENVAVDVPITTTRITLQPMGANIKLPVRARDIANDDGEILDTVSVAGSTGSISDRIQNLNSTGVLTRDETTDDANVYRPAPSAVSLSAGTYNNYDLIDGANVFIGGAGAKILTGIVADAGREVTITCAQGTLQLNDQDTNSSANNRFAIPFFENLILRVGESVTLSHQFNRWYVKNNYVRSNQVNPVTDLGTITTNQEDDWDIGEGIYFTVEPTSLISPAPDLDVTGIDGVAGRTVTIINESSNRDISFKHQDSSSLAANRFTLPGSSDFTLSTDHNSATFYKPNDTIGWVLISNT